MLKKKEWNGKEVEWFVKESKPYTGAVHIDRGWGNGYAVIPKHNALYGVDNIYEHGFDLELGAEITFTGMMEHQGKEYYVIGFDTAHFGDSLLRWPKEAVEAEAKLWAKEIKKFNHAK